jgi:L-threonylcarbamoyladenylate synthase
VEKVFQLKDRPHHKPILLLIGNRDALGRLVRKIPDEAEPLMERFWPGRLTILFEATASLSPLLTAGTGKIGVRLPGHPVASALVRELKNPITGTSANLSGSPGSSKVSDLAPVLTEKLDLILDSGPLKGGVGSTVVDVTVSPPRVLREGGVSSKNLFKALSIPA